ncbi:hypothetical protein CI102_9380 [Trichoderma harzianum]|uniref:F-box domain-containing protein n=1 Tax=Trichoderma harzianum CBS 226.95 TaxID=983964 RepID=A0A2T4AJY7_TRIHA|nr:hypothetical protein M431DRAFT_547507 [Trichoderma harzianum CBS 226.95]PKK47660.1 hypothetical protein CI102_9380 [Trichoderma harzianum]PTB57248.1 hypothetical protein M431DRAFT_547507 [Trichoderma harzianum CBS 226.95]
MACLLDLPSELFFEIVKLLDIGGKINLSSTCKFYRAQLLPEIFKTIRLTIDETSATSARTVVETYGQYTKTIEFICQCERDDRATAPSLLPAACEVLKGHFTPNLRTVKVKFDFDLDNEANEVYQDFDFHEDANYTRETELRDKWRALMNETWEALVANTLIIELILDWFPPKWTSTYRTDAFRQFLNQLESATINIFGFEDYSGVRTNTMVEYCQFLAKLDTLFFRHMRGLKCLHIQASDPLGYAEEATSIPLALKPGDLPLLQSLTLENCFVCPELISFIQSHAQVLKFLDIDECFCEHGSEMTWAKFFDEIYEAKPRLTELLAGGNKAPFLFDEMPNWEANDAVLLMRQKLEADSTLKIFRQMHLDPDEGILTVNHDKTVERFNRGDDQRAYDRLMALVNENRQSLT